MTMKLLLCFATISLVTTSCYRIPGDDDFSVVPTTNNRSLTSEKPALVPGVAY